MNKKLFALLLVTALALQLKAADPDGAGKAEDQEAGAPYWLLLSRGAASTPSAARDDQDDIDDDQDDVDFIMPEANYGIVRGLLKRCLGLVWTTRPENIKDILTYGAHNYHKMNLAEKAAYFNAQDAQWGLSASRVLKVTRLLIVATFAKKMMDDLLACDRDAFAGLKRYDCGEDFSDDFYDGYDGYIVYHASIQYDY